MVIETVSRFTSNGSDVNAVFLDASKAFDRVNYLSLFNKLIGKGLPCIYIRCLLNMYTNGQLQVKWNSKVSDPFPCTNGVKQGGVLSPILFSIYIDDLLKQLRLNNIGCHVNNVFCGAFSYADDFVLLAPTSNSLKSMLHLCESYSRRFDIEFNPSKSKLITFSKNKTCIDLTIYLNGTVIPTVERIKYLGHILYKDITHCGFDNIISDFNMKVNLFHLDFGSLQCDIKSRLFKQYCCSFYGTQLCELDSIAMYRICRAWRVGFRKILGLPYRTHSDMLPILGNIMKLHDWFIKRFFKFFTNANNSKNAVVKHLTNLSRVSNSPMGKNFRYICYRFGFTISMFDNINAVLRYFHNKIDTCNDTVLSNKCNMIKELINVRDGYSDSLLDGEEIRHLIQHMCCT